MACRNDFVDKVGPIVWPLLLEDRDQDQIEFSNQCTVAFQLLVGIRILDNEIDDKVTNPYVKLTARTYLIYKGQTLTLIAWKYFPSRHNNIIENL